MLGGYLTLQKNIFPSSTKYECFLEVVRHVTSFQESSVSDTNDDSTSDLHGSYVCISIVNSKYDHGLNFNVMMLVSSS